MYCWKRVTFRYVRNCIGIYYAQKKFTKIVNSTHEYVQLNVYFEFNEASKFVLCPA